jgi:manganese-dependent inorganic pyrophosphatase
MEKCIYVIGHRNPDTDSVVSAAAYARLKQAQGFSNCRAARAGKITPQTEYIFERFGVPVPEYLSDLTPKAGYYLEPAVTIPADASIWDALELMQKDSFRVLPVVDQDGRYQSMFYYRGFARYIIAHINPQKKAAFSLSLGQLARTIRAQPVTLFDPGTIRRSSIVVAAASEDFFRSHIEVELPENCIVITGDREEIHRYCIERKVRALVLSNGTTLSQELAARAEANRVSVMISPFDTSSTAMLIIYSIPVGEVGDNSVPLIGLGDTIRQIRDPLLNAPSRCLPVGDQNGRVAGVIFDGDLVKEPCIEIIMVDHNEPSQAIEGIENYKVLEVLDHHRLGNFSTRYPITFINKVVGATCTIVTELYRGQRIPMDRGIASILLCGILADTLALQSATTTDEDREAAEYLASITGLEIQTLARELQSAGSQVNDVAARELVAMDMKEYAERGVAFSVSQIETDSPENLVGRKAEILGALEATRSARDMLFSALMVTDVTVLDSLLFVAGDPDFIALINFPKRGDNLYFLKEMVSRKKQLLPLLSELVEKARS